MARIQTMSDVVQRFRTNASGFFQQYRYWLIVAGIAAVADMASTIDFMLRDGVDGEVHPAIRTVAVYLGPIAGPVIGKLCQFAALVVIAVYLRAQAIYIFVTVTILYSWAAWYNVWGWQIYQPRLLELLDWTSRLFDTGNCITRA